MKISAIIKLIIISLIAILIICGCEIEEKIEKAADRCEDKISRVLEGVEDICLTKEEILELINSVQEFEDTNDAYVCEEDASP
jgi:metal-dependent hydrolase (beta-lactamase superfamily II)